MSCCVTTHKMSCNINAMLPDCNRKHRNSSGLNHAASASEAPAWFCSISCNCAAHLCGGSSPKTWQMKSIAWRLLVSALARGPQRNQCTGGSEPCSLSISRYPCQTTVTDSSRVVVVVAVVGPYVRLPAVVCLSLPWHGHPTRTSEPQGPNLQVSMSHNSNDSSSSSTCSSSSSSSSGSRDSTSR